jgi:TonB family protein
VPTLNDMIRKLTCVLLLFLLTIICGAPLAGADVPAEHHPTRKVLKKVLPSYPELARQLNIKGAVKLVVIVEPNGKVKSARAVGGNPAFVEAAMRVIEKWKFEPAADPTTETVEIKFEPTE